MGGRRRMRTLPYSSRDGVHVYYTSVGIILSGCNRKQPTCPPCESQLLNWGEGMNDFSLMVSREIDHAEWRWVFVCSVALLVLITSPFVWAYGVGGSDAHFMGVLV